MFNRGLETEGAAKSAGGFAVKAVLIGSDHRIENVGCDQGALESWMKKKGENE